MQGTHEIQFALTVESIHSLFSTTSGLRVSFNSHSLYVECNSLKHYLFNGETAFILSKSCYEISLHQNKSRL